MQSHDAGTLGSRRHINLPGVRVNLPPLTEKDLADVALGVELDVDFVALVSCAKRAILRNCGALLKKSQSKAQIIAKIEDQSAVRQIDEMIEAADVDHGRARRSRHRMSRWKNCRSSSGES